MRPSLAKNVAREAYRCSVCGSLRKEEIPKDKTEREILYECGSILIIYKEKASYQYRFLGCQKKLK